MWLNFQYKFLITIILVVEHKNLSAMSEMEYYSAELMVYFEKTRFLEVLRVLIIRIGMDRPLFVKHYLRKNLRRIANSVLTKNSIVCLPSELDVNMFVKSCLNTYRIPIIAYNTRGQKVDARKLSEILKKFEKFCKKYGLHNKDKIFLNVPHSLDEAFQIENNTSGTINFVHVTKENNQVEPDFKDVLDYYGCSVKKVPAEFEGVARNVENSIVPEVMQTIKYSSNSFPYDIEAHFVYRVVIMGRRGSGRKTQAKALAKRFNLVFIEMNSLVQTTLQNRGNMARVLSCSLKEDTEPSSSALTSLLWKRVLQNDALSKGWVVVGFPNCLKELKLLVGKFETPPNRVALIHCNSTTCLRRLVRQWERSKCQLRIRMNMCAYVEREFEKFDRSKKEMYKYLKNSRTKTIHINGNCDVCHVKCKMFALLNR